MKVLLDENLPHDLQPLLMPMHAVFTVAYLGWSGMKNGKLIAKAASDGFDALITKDQKIEFEQNLANLPLRVVVLNSASNKVEDIRPLLPELLMCLDGRVAHKLVKIG